MKNIFHKLPQDVIYKILLYDEHFIMRKGKMIDIIPKTDYRYNLMKHIIHKKIDIIRISNEKDIDGFSYLQMFQRSFYYHWAFYGM
jgi:hypothetical protein